MHVTLTMAMMTSSPLKINVQPGGLFWQLVSPSSPHSPVPTSVFWISLSVSSIASVETMKTFLHTTTGITHSIPHKTQMALIGCQVTNQKNRFNNIYCERSQLILFRGFDRLENILIMIFEISKIYFSIKSQGPFQLTGCSEIPIFGYSINTDQSVRIYIND